MLALTLALYHGALRADHPSEFDTVERVLRSHADAGPTQLAREVVLALVWEDHLRPPGLGWCANCGNERADVDIGGQAWCASCLAEEVQTAGDGIHPASLRLLALVRELNEDHVLEHAYGVDQNDGTPLSAALAAWVAGGYPDTVRDGDDADGREVTPPRHAPPSTRRSRTVDDEPRPTRQPTNQGETP